jgi:hypothetical protein
MLGDGINRPMRGHQGVARGVPPHGRNPGLFGNAFALVLQALPTPIFGDRFIQGVAPLIAARHLFSCPSDATSRWSPSTPVPFRLTGLRGITPAFGYGALTRALYPPIWAQLCAIF